MFIRDMDRHPDLRRLRRGEASIEDMKAWANLAPEEVLRSPSLGTLSLEDPGEWKEVLREAVHEFSKRAISFSIGYVGASSEDFIDQSRAMLRAATREFGPQADRGLQAAIIAVFTTKFPSSNFRPILTEMIAVTARLVPSPVSLEAEKLTVIHLMKGHSVPPEIAPYAHPWKAESWA